MSPQLRTCVQMSSMAILSINQDLTFIMSLFCLLEAIEEHIITRLLDGRQHTCLCEKTYGARSLDPRPSFRFYNG